MVFYLGFSAVTSVGLGWGVFGIYVGVFLYYLSAFCVVAIGFRYGDWAARADELMSERGSTADDD